MNLEDAVYDIWASPQTEKIEEAVCGAVEVTEQFSEGAIDKIINRIYNVTSIYAEDTIEWIESVQKVILSFVDED